jgi:hypothetical protein
VSRNRGSKEQRATRRARERQAAGDPRPYMAILKAERDRLGIILPVEKSRRPVQTIRSELL